MLKLIDYKKTGCILRLFGWLQIVTSIILIVTTCLAAVPFAEIDKTEIFLFAIFLVIISIFQLHLAKAINAHEDWGRKLGFIYGLMYLPFAFPWGLPVGLYVLLCLIKGWGQDIPEKESNIAI